MIDLEQYWRTLMRHKWGIIGFRFIATVLAILVLFSIKPLPGLPSGTEIQNSAEIQFEIFEVIQTRLCGSAIDEPQPVVNIIDTTAPNCTVDPLPPQTSSLDFPISWTGMDAIGEIDTYSIFVSVDGGIWVGTVPRGAVY